MADTHSQQSNMISRLKGRDRKGTKKSSNKSAGSSLEVITPGTTARHRDDLVIHVGHQSGAPTEEAMTIARDKALIERSSVNGRPNFNVNRGAPVIAYLPLASGSSKGATPSGKFGKVYKHFGEDGAPFGGVTAMAPVSFQFWSWTEQWWWFSFWSWTVWR